MADRLLLVRHGQTTGNRSGLLQGRADRLLTDLGNAQAAQLAAVLRDCGATACYSSPLSRARATAEPIAAALGVAVIVDERLVELDYGDWEGRPVADVRPDEWAYWRGDASFAPPGGESLLTLGARARSFAAGVLDGTPGVALAVTHLAPIKALVAWALGADDSLTWRLQLDVAATCEVALRGDQPLLVRYNVPVH
jgi:broad specificity phosphatase PhoE